MATNYYGELGNYKGQFSGGTQASNPKNNVVIGGVSFGKNWNDSDAAALQHMQLQASIDQQLAEREYNTPFAQAQRMRAAGLNPDLQNFDNGNSSVSAGVGSPSGESASAQNARTAQSIQSMVELLPQAIQTVQSMQAHSHNMSMNELELLAGAETEALNLASHHTRLESYTEDNPNYQNVPTFHIKNRRLRKLIDEVAPRYAYWHPLVKRNVLSRYSDSLDAEFDYILNNERKSLTDTDALFVDCLRELWRFEYSSKRNKSKFESDYYGNVSGKDFAESDAAIKKNSSLDDVDKEFSDYISKMWKSNDKWDNLKAAVLFLLTKMSGGFSVGPKGTTKSIGF